MRGASHREEEAGTIASLILNKEKTHMDHFVYRNGELFAEDVAVAKIAAEVGTPAYIYSKATLLTHYRRIAEAFAPLRRVPFWLPAAGLEPRLCQRPSPQQRHPRGCPP